MSEHLKIAGVSGPSIEQSGSTVDIKKLSAKIEEYEKQILSLSSTKSKLFAILSHDLRSPFNGLLGFTNFLADEIDSLSNDEIKIFANNISSSARNLLELVDEVFNWAKAECGETEFIPIRVELNYVAEEVFFLLKKNAITKEIELINRVPKESYVFADMNMVKTIMHNLVSNAIKFSNPGGKVSVGCIRNTTGFVEITVEDKGIGIPKENAEKLFRIETHFSTRGTANEKGTGLGLIICKTLAEKNKGMISVKTSEGKGTTFKVCLPATD